MKRYRFGTVLCLMLIIMLPGCPGLGSTSDLTADVRTLMLAHFDDQASVADYANGWPEFAGSGAHLIDGYYGKAIDLRGIQLEPDFMNTAEGRLPLFSGFGFWPRSNLNLYQGTIEFWFKVSLDGSKQGINGDHLFYTSSSQMTKPGELSDMRLSQKQLMWEWYTLSGELLSGRVDFPEPLDPNDWHYFTMSWSQGEFAIYIDGRLASAQDMTGKFGPIFLAVPHYPLLMSGIAMDEFRISNVVRYSDAFEPRWHDGKRPSYAFKGVPGVSRYPQKLEEVYVPKAASYPMGGHSRSVTLGGMVFVFDESTGFLRGFSVNGKTVNRNTNGLLLWEGLERVACSSARASDWKQTEDVLSFRQKVGNGIILTHHLRQVSDSIQWEVLLDNQSEREAWLEALISLPVPFREVKQYFDMSCTQDQLQLPRRVDEYVFSLPFVAAVGKQESLGIGTDPHIDLASLVSEYIPESAGATIRQGTKIVLSPKESFSIKWRIFVEDADFGTQNALARYHSMFPDLYEQDSAVPIYSYMPISRYQDCHSYTIGDIMRVCYSGQQWGHGPGWMNGDEWGSELFWNMPKDKDRTDYQESLKYQRLYNNDLDYMRRVWLLYNKRAYYNDYTIRRFHYLPNWAEPFIVETLYPEGMVGGDPMVIGQYYFPSMYYANERDTPVGKHYKESTWNVMKHIGLYCPGFINDMCHTSARRFTDPIARETPGRAFSRDKGVYVVGGFGHADRYRLINSFKDERGFRQSIWSDGGVVSYQLSSCSAANAIESVGGSTDLDTVELGHKAARNLLGEKPMNLHDMIEGLSLPGFDDPASTDPAVLRDYFRYAGSQTMLHAARHGVGLMRETVQGRQQLMELNPMLVESLVSGRKTIDAVKVNEPLFVRRGGEGMRSILVVGNEKPRKLSTPVIITNRFFDGRPIFGAYFGGEIREELGSATSTILDTAVEPRSMVGFRTLGILKGSSRAQVTTRFDGDGLTMQAVIEIETQSPTALELNTFAPIYRIESISMNGKQIGTTSSVKLPKGKSTLAVSYRTPVLQFSADAWKSVDLIRDGRTNFCLITDQPEPSAQNIAEMKDLSAPFGMRIDNEMHFDNGTAHMLNQFIDQYDEEDGVLRDLTRAQLVASPPPGFAGWKVYIRSDVDVNPSRVRIDAPTRSIYVEGKSTGEARRATVVFLRLLDRKYPHIGKLFDLRKGQGEELSKSLFDTTAQALFNNISDKRFLSKPVLDRSLENVYADDNTNFEGKYTLRCSPYIYEPTYSDGYVYGYKGE